MDQPSLMMWCIVSNTTCSSALNRSSRTRSSGPRARSNGRCASSFPNRTISAARSRCLQRAQIHYHERAVARRRKLLHRHTVTIGKVVRTLRAAAPLPLMLAPTPRHPARRPDAHPRNVVERAPRFQLVEEPQSLLRKRQRQVAATRNSFQRQCFYSHRPHAAPIYSQRQLRDRRRLEDNAQRQLHPKRFANARDDLRRQQRVPAQLEEVSVNADLLPSSAPAPRSRSTSLPLACAPQRKLACLGAIPLRFRQRLAIHFAVRRQRQFTEGHETLTAPCIPATAASDHAAARCCLQPRLATTT